MVPSSQECVDKVREVTKQFQQVYSADYMEEQTKVHLMSYPIMVHNDGTVETEPDWEMFPDTQAKVCGKKIEALPGNLNYLTT